MKNSFRILIVDDEETQRTLIRGILAVSKMDCAIAEACNGVQALQMINDSSFDVVLLDKRLPSMDGDEVCRRVRQDPKNILLPIIMISGTNEIHELARSFSLGVTDFIRKPYNPVELTSRITAALSMKRATDQLDSAESLLFALARMVEAKDETTGDHCSRLAYRSVVFGKALGLSKSDLEALRKGGVLHDIGKLGIPDSILMKQSALSDEEWKVMRQHTVIGAKLCEGLTTMRDVLPIILHHHEHWNGTGYPHQLAGSEIPLLARVFQIIDIYDALASERPYKTAFSRERIIDIFQEEAGKGWRDPELTQEFLAILRSTPECLDMPPNQPKRKDEVIFELIASAGGLDWDRSRNYQYGLIH
jgi:putative two-component system response regulator